MLINNGISHSAQGVNTAKLPVANDKAGQKQAHDPSSTDKVNLSNEAQRLSSLEAQVAVSDDVDTNKVESIRKAIAEGSYQIDADAIAEKMLASDELS